MCLTSLPTPIHKGIHKGGRPPKAAAPLCGGGRRPPPLWMGVRWLGGQQTRQKHASLAKNKQVRRKVGAQGTKIHNSKNIYLKYLLQNAKNPKYNKSKIHKSNVFCMKWVAIRDLEAFVARVSMEFRSGSTGRGPRAQQICKYAENVQDF